MKNQKLALQSKIQNNNDKKAKEDNNMKKSGINKTVNFLFFTDYKE